MAAFVREFPDADWHVGRTAGAAAALRNIDEKTKKAINGAGGGTWAPAARITITSTVPSDVAMHATGPWDLAGSLLTGVGKHVQLGGGAADDYVRLGAGHPGVTRVLETGVTPVIPSEYLSMFAPLNDILGCVARFPGARGLIPIAPHDRSTLTSVRLSFIEATIRGNIPAWPKFRVIRVDTSGNVESLHTPRSGGYGDDGFLTMPTGTAGVVAYFAGGLQQWSAPYAPDRFNVIAASDYGYFIDWVEESGVNAFTPNIGANYGVAAELLSVELTCGSISLLAPQ